MNRGDIVIVDNTLCAFCNGPVQIRSSEPTLQRVHLPSFERLWIVSNLPLAENCLMRPVAFALFVALLGILATMDRAAGQTAGDIGGAPEHIRNADQIKRVCDNMRTTRRTPPFEAADQFFLDAIDQYCAFGEFAVFGTNERGDCPTKKRLSAPHLTIIKQLHLIRPQPVRQIVFRCVTISGLLSIEDLDASMLQFIDVDAEDVRLVRVKLSTGLVISGSKFSSGLGLLRVVTNGPLQIQRKSEIGNNSRWGAAFVT